MTCRRRLRSKSGFKTKRASARRTARFGSGLSGERGRANPPISATTTPICSAPSPGARRRRGARAALCRHRSDATPPRRNLAPRREGAHAVLLLDRAGGTHRQARRAQTHRPIFLPSRAPELNPVENMAVPARQLALQPRLRKRRRHHRRGMRGFAEAHRPARNDHLHRDARLGAHRSDLRAVGVIR